MTTFEPQYKYSTETYFQVYSGVLNEDRNFDSLDRVDLYISQVGGQFRVKKRTRITKQEIEWGY